MDRWSTAERLCGLAGGDLAQHGRFGLLHLREAQALRRGRVGVWQGEEGPRAYLTTVIRVPLDLAERVRAAALPAAAARPDGHYLYPADALHITLANLDRYADLPLERLAETLADRVADAPPITFTLRGLAVARHTVYVRAYAQPAPALLALRASILRELGSEPPRQEPLRIAVSNVVRFRCADLTAVLPAVRAHRNACFGSFPLHRVELVRTDKVLSAAGTELLAAFDTGP
ncbi:2'-5' RNA ligase family protein [Frankia sp. AgB1.9]|uniref:2'-5' RNA ligase family protein n=1 Tax=unclassified Frankia TaxID=2632575 RepID=UPI00193424F4|nr:MULTISPECIES: 2'-5' RNA ligase family protein [unclassified Frankia]MBL7489845.1 2'-5' RNA ligase family protein [Frankia sp. AgW1.1]MBL7552695.1 2'-5' RNA ligase family protein [Frankia sp. AgB1.9]MBL7623860.1 2'-5' RNA ligase family protein [Frankia sp. AgB1.8]